MPFSMARTPGEVAEITAGYRLEMDRLAPFLDDCCLLDPEQRVSSMDLHTAYQRWRQEAGGETDQPDRPNRESGGAS